MKRVLPLIAALAAAPLLSAQQPSPTPFDPELLRLQVETLLQMRAQAKAATRANAVAEILKRSQTGNGAVNFFEDAYASLNFAGKPSAGQAKVDWARSNSDMLKSPEFKAAAQLYLQYLALTIERAGSKQSLDFVEPSLKYIRDYSEGEAKLFARQAKVPDEQRKLLTSPLPDSAIVRANNLQSMIRDIPNWEPVPGNLDGIFEKNILGPLRAAKDERLLEAWKLRMKMGDKTAAAQKSDSRKDNFLNQQFPSWRFAHAEDLIVLGKTQDGLGEMYLLLQNYPNHPSFEKWGQRLLELLKPATPAAAPAADGN